jgi:hypothetical protein
MFRTGFGLTALGEAVAGAARLTLEPSAMLFATSCASCWVSAERASWSEAARSLSPASELPARFFSCFESSAIWLRIWVCWPFARRPVSCLKVARNAFATSCASSRAESGVSPVVLTLISAVSLTGEAETWLSR